MDLINDEETFSSHTPTKIVTAAPVAKDSRKPFDWIDGENEDGVIGKRAPLGQASENEDEVYLEEKWDYQGAPVQLNNCANIEYLRQLEEEQEQLSNSLYALTSHFAQVQLRLKQIIDAPETNKESLLKELEGFAFRGVPDLRERSQDAKDLISPVPITHEEVMEQQKQKQRDLMERLRNQLQDLETYAYETGDGGIPSNVLLERQGAIIKQLKDRNALNLEEIEVLSPEEFREKIDSAIKEIVNPVKVKEQLVEQLQTQVTDLERYIDFLQTDAASTVNAKCACTCDSHIQGRGAVCTDSDTTDEEGTCRKHPPRRRLRRTVSEEERHRRDRIVEKMANLMHLFAMLNFGSCSRQEPVFQSNSMKATPRGNHWGDLRAKLELAIDKVLRDVDTADALQSSNSDYASESDESPDTAYNEQLTISVRKDLAGTLRDLLQHGLEGSSSRSLLPSMMGCFASRFAQHGTVLHIWDLILKYYFFKNGPQYNATPARRLSESFNLNIVNVASSKKILLSVIHNIICSHTPLRRSADTHFKAFVCAALNEKKLTVWLKMILRCKPIVDRYYTPWSYVRKSGFEDALRSLDRIGSIHFNLPVDLAVKQMQEIHDAF